jgi:predicted nucleic-acid-binding protein
LIALDTNILVQYLVREHSDQWELATDLIRALTIENPGFISREVALETVWVLHRVYRYSRNQIAATILHLIATEGITTEAADDVSLAINRFGQGVPDFADLMILAAARRNGASAVFTFDRRFSRLAGVRLVESAQ